MSRSNIWHNCFAELRKLVINNRVSVGHCGQAVRWYKSGAGVIPLVAKNVAYRTESLIGGASCKIFI